MIRKPKTKDRISKDSQFEAERLAYWSCWSPCEDSPAQTELKKKKSKIKTENNKKKKFQSCKIDTERERVRNTLAPLFVDGDDFIDDVDVGETTALGFADDFGVASFLYSEEIDI